jgi:hypothetical protein
MKFIIDASYVITMIGLGVCFAITAIVLIPFYPIAEQYRKSRERI